MTTVDNIRNSLIDDLLCISDENSLLELQKIVKNKYAPKNEIPLTNEQIIMLQMSEDDIKNGRVVSHEDAYKADLEWLNSLK
jgi:hypothetical protein